MSPSSRDDCTPDVVRDAQGNGVVINPRDWEDRYALEETFMPYFSYGMSPLMGLRHQEFHFIEAPRPELYNVRKDPGESTNLLAGADGAKLHQEWSDQLARAIKNYSGPRARSQQPLPVPNANADPALLKSLAQLGYVGNAGGGTENLPDPKDAIDLVVKLRQGETLSGDGKHAEAAAIYEEVIRRAPSNFNAYGLLANERLSLKQPAEALRIYQTALKKNGKLEFLRLGEATTLDALHDPAAEAKFKSILRDNPRFADGFMAYYEFLHQKGRHDEANADLEAALKAGHDDAEIRYRLGEEAFRRNQLPAAEAQLRKAVAFNKWHAEALARLAELVAPNNPQEARGFYQRAIEERPDRMDWRNAMMALPK
jgi:tetratricopeptide (TPR) repeat protein